MEGTFYADRQEEAPLLKEREVFLEHLLQQGTSLAAARNVSWQLHAANALYSSIAFHRLGKLRVHLICDNHDVR
jgi:hypothetical protein